MAADDVDVQARIDELLPMIRKAEGSGDDAVSPRGAVGRYQIMPATARALGFNPAQLKDPAVNEKAARAAVADLIRQHGPDDTKAILAGYNASPAAVSRWKAAGRNDSVLPAETQHYFARAGFHEGSTQSIAAPADTGGAARAQAMLDAGAPSDQVNAWKTQRKQAMLEAGAPQDKVDAYWGDTAPDTKPLENLIRGNLAQVPPDKRQEMVDTPLKAIEYGWQTTVGALAMRGQGPDRVLPENAGMFTQALAGLTQAAGDLPFSVAGMIGGAVAGEASPVPGGGVLGGGAGAVALPNAMRNVLMDHYEHRDDQQPLTLRSFLGRATNLAAKTVKDMALGAVTFAAGGATGAKLLEAGARPLIVSGGKLVSMAAAGTGASSAMEGHLPTADEAAAGALTLLGLHVAGEVVGAKGRYSSKPAGAVVEENLKDIYRSSGVRPTEAAAKAAQDPVANFEVLSRTPEGEQVTPTFDEAYRTNPAALADEHADMMQQLFTEAAQNVNKPKDTRSPEQITAAEEKRKAYLAEKAAGAEDNVNDFEDARLKHSLAAIGEHDYGSPPNEPPRPEPEIISPEPGPKKVTDQTIKPTFDTLADKFMEGKTGEQPKRSDKWYNPKTIYRQFVTELYGARAIDREIGVEPKDMGTEDWLRQTYASHERADHFMRRGTLKASTDPNEAFKPAGGPAYLRAAEILKEDGGNMKGWEAYRVAASTLDRAKRGIKTGFDPEQAKPIVEMGKKTYARATASVQETKNGAIDYTRDAGMFSKDSAQKMKVQNPDHINLRRIVDPSFRESGGRGFTVAQRIKRATSSDRALDAQVTANDVHNMGVMISMADRNLARASFVKLAENQEAKPGEKGHIDLQKVKFEPKGKVEIFGPDGKKIDLTPEEEKKLEPFLIERAVQGEKDPGIFPFFKDGKVEYWKTSDPELARLLQVVQPGPEANIVVEAASAFSRLQRLGITTEPDFTARSWTRAQFEAAILSPHGGVPFQNFLAGVSESFKMGSRIREEWQAMGGGGASLYAMDKDVISGELRKVFEATGTENSTLNLVRHPIDALRAARTWMDTTSRIGYYKRLRGKGYSGPKAAVESRKAYIDHQERAGLAAMNTLARVTTFMRTSVLDVDQMVTAMKDRPVTTLIAGLAAITLPTVLNRLANYYADKAHEGEPGWVPYSELPRWQKDADYVLPIAYPGGARVRIPFKPYVTRFFFSTLVERAMDTWLFKDPRGFEEWGESFLASVVPPVLPAVALPVMEDYFNYRAINGKPLVPGYLEKASGYMQYTPDTTETAKAISRFLSPEVGVLAQAGKGIELSPVALDNYARQWGGTLPFDILKALDGTWKQHTRPETIADMPFVKSFVARNPGFGAQSIQDFYSEAGKVEEAQRNKTLAKQRGNVAEMRETFAVQQAAINVSTKRTALANQMQIIQQINDSKTLTDGEKLKNTDALYRMMILQAKAGLKEIDIVNGR